MAAPTEIKKIGTGGNFTEDFLNLIEPNVKASKPEPAPNKYALTYCLLSLALRINWRVARKDAASTVEPKMMRENNKLANQLRMGQIFLLNRHIGLKQKWHQPNFEPKT